MSTSETLFWFRWALVTIVAFAAVLPAVAALHPMLAGGLSGLVVGFVQWFVLRRRAPWAWQWVWATVVGFFVPVTALGYLARAEWFPLPAAIHLFVRYTLVGIFAGISQWFVLHRHVTRAGWWMPTSIVGYTASMVAMVIWSILFERATIPVQVLLSMIFGLVLGASTGGVMVLLLRRPRQDEGPREMELEEERA